MPERIPVTDVVLAWRPDIGGAVISVLVDALSRDRGPEAVARVGVEDDEPYLERHDGRRLVLRGLDVEDVLEALDNDVVVVREFADAGRGESREYRVECLSPAAAPRF